MTDTEPKIDAAWIDEVLPIAEAGVRPTCECCASGGYRSNCSCDAERFLATFDPSTVIRMLKELRQVFNLREAIYAALTELEYSGHPIGHDKACSVAARLRAALAAQEKP